MGEYTSPRPSTVPTLSIRWDREMVMERSHAEGI